MQSGNSLLFNIKTAKEQIVEFRNKRGNVNVKITKKQLYSENL